VIEALHHGPLDSPSSMPRFNLITGQFHAVDSSDQAFKTAGRQASKKHCRNASRSCSSRSTRSRSPLQCVHRRVQRLVSDGAPDPRYDAKPDWPGWDIVSANLPQKRVA